MLLAKNKKDIKTKRQNAQEGEMVAVGVIPKKRVKSKLNIE